MNLNHIKKTYDDVISLGYWCGIANQLKRYRLRKFSGPFDWLYTPDLSSINRLLKNNFEDFIKPENMKFTCYSSGTIDNNGNLVFENNNQKTYILRDTKYNITSVHDFHVIEGKSWADSYPDVREKFNRRINNFKETISKNNSTLFVRCHAQYNEVIELKNILSVLTKNEFHILIVNPVPGIIYAQEKNWGLDKVVCIEVPFMRTGEDLLNEMTKVDDQIWKNILHGIKVTNSRS